MGLTVTTMRCPALAGETAVTKMAAVSTNAVKHRPTESDGIARGGRGYWGICREPIRIRHRR